MEKRLFQISLLVIIFGLIWSSSSRRVLGTEFYSAPTDIATGNSEWRLLVNGSVYHPLNLTFNDLVKMPKSTVYADLYCYEDLVTTGYWTGVRLGLVLEKAGLYPQTDSLEFVATDGYRTELGITDAMREDVLLAYEKDGQPLNETLRLVIPGTNGDKWISMIAHIELHNPNFRSLEIKNNSFVFAHEGDVIENVIVVTNWYDSPLANVTVNDEITGFNWEGNLDRGESKTFNVACIVPAGVNGPLTSKVAVSAELANSTIYADDIWTVDVIHPKLEVDRTVEPTEINVGDNVTYTSVVKNIGDTTLFNLTLVDSIYGYVPKDLVPSSLKPGDSFTWTFNASIYEATSNTATATGADTLGMQVSDFAESSVEVKSDKSGNSNLTEWLFSIYAPYIIATAAATTAIVYITTIRKRRRQRASAPPI